MDIPTFEELIKQIKQNLWVIGTPIGDVRISIRLYLVMFLVTLIFVLETCFFCSRISPETFLELADLAPCSAITILSILKMFAFAFKRYKLNETVASLKRLHQDILRDSEKRQVVKREIILLKMFLKYYFVLNVTLVSCYNFQTLLIMAESYVVKKETIFCLPFGLLLPFNIDTWSTWILVYLFSITSAYLCVLLYTTIDASYFMLATCVCANFKIISDQIRRLDVDSVHLLKNIVKDHQHILKLADDFEDIFSAINLFNVLYGSLQICVLGISITMGPWTQIPRCILFLFVILMQMLTMSFFGEHIIQESTNICEAAYLCKWYKMDERSKKTLLNIMIRSHKPSILTAYKFSVISYESFTKIISTSWSYFTILRTVYTPPESS